MCFCKNPGPADAHGWNCELSERTDSCEGFKVQSFPPLMLTCQPFRFERRFERALPRACQSLGLSCSSTLELEARTKKPRSSQVRRSSAHKYGVSRWSQSQCPELETKLLGGSSRALCLIRAGISNIYWGLWCNRAHQRLHRRWNETSVQTSSQMQSSVQERR